MRRSTEGALASRGLAGGRRRPAVQALGAQDAPDAVAVEVGQEVADHEGEVIEGEVVGAAQRADHGPLLLGGLPGQLVRLGGAVEAVLRAALAPLADGIGADTVALGQHAAGLIGAGDLGADGGGGAGIGMDLEHGSPPSRL